MRGGGAVAAGPRRGGGSGPGPGPGRLRAGLWRRPSPPPAPAFAGRGPVVRPRPRRGALPAAAGRAGPGWAGREPAAVAVLTFPVFEAPAARSPRGGGRGPAPAVTG